MPPHLLKRYPVAKADLEVEELEDEILVYDPGNQKTYNFNGTGAFVWSLCDGSHSLEEMVEGIHEAAPGTDRETIEQDVADFVRELEEDGLITLRDD